MQLVSMQNFHGWQDIRLTKEIRINTRRKQWSGKILKKTVDSDIIVSSGFKEVAEVHTVGKINKDIYKCITEDIRTDEVVITDNQIQHIKDRHPEAYEKALRDMKAAIENPDYIIGDDKHKNTGLVVKRIESDKSNLQLVLRVCTSEDETEYMNSIISCWEISERRLRNYLRNKRVLYKNE